MKAAVRLAVTAVVCIVAVATVGLAKEGGARKAGKVKEAGAEKTKEAKTDKVNNHTEARQERQAKRIEEGVKKGYLTKDELGKVEEQQKSIETLQKSFKSDGKITKDEAKQLHQQLNDASLSIFTEKHDADGNTKSVLRLGKNVTLKSDVAQKLEDPNLTKQDARAFLKDFHQALEIKKTLSNGNVSDTERTTMQNEYNTLLNKYFDTK